MKKIQTLCLFLFLLIGSSTFAQKTMNEGIIELEITKVDCDNEGMASMFQMLKGSEVSVAFDKDHSLMTMNMMSGMMKTRILNTKSSKKVLTLIDAMGQKMANESKMEVEEGEIVIPAEMKVDVAYDKTDTKKILEYTCHKATIKIPIPGQADKSMNIVAYVTEDITLEQSLIQAIKADQLKGTPLEYTLTVPQQGMTMSMTFTATGIKKTVDSSIFEIDTEGYKEVSLEEMQSMGGGMGF